MRFLSHVIALTVLYACNAQVQPSWTFCVLAPGCTVSGDETIVNVQHGVGVHAARETCIQANQDYCYPETNGCNSGGTNSTHCEVISYAHTVDCSTASFTSNVSYWIFSSNWTGTVILKNGTVTEQSMNCPEGPALGYWGDDGICYDCKPIMCAKGASMVNGSCVFETGVPSADGVPAAPYGHSHPQGT